MDKHVPSSHIPEERETRALSYFGRLKKRV